MTIAQLDFYFPFIAFFYGFVMTAVLSSEFLMKLSRERLPATVHQRFVSHQTLGMVCLVVGGVWSLQTLWLR